MHQNRQNGARARYEIDKDVVSLPEVYIEQYGDDADHILKNCFNSLWNAFGLSLIESELYWEKGVPLLQ